MSTSRSASDDAAGVRAPGADRGSVTVEAALSLFTVVLILAMALAGIGCAVAQVRCVDAAREVARLLARGDNAGAATALAQTGPSGASMSTHVGPEMVSVTVRARPVGGLLPGVQLSATAVAAMEPGVGSGGDGAAG